MARGPRFTALLVALLLPTLGGCGYLLFPERAGQTTGRVDWGVIGLDAVGLLVGVVPGVIAFAVDFATGCVYLPSAPYAATSAEAPTPPADEWPGGWREIAVVDLASRGAVAAALADYVGRPQAAAELEAAIEWQGAAHDAAGGARRAPHDGNQFL